MSRPDIHLIAESGFSTMDAAECPYDAIAEHWISHRASLRPGEEKYLQLLLDGLPPSSSVLDLGCGTGVPNATSVIAAGHCVVGVDQSEQLLLAAKKNAPEATWIQADIRSFEAEQRFAGVICWDALFHLPRTEHRAVLSKIHGLLASGGRVILTSGGSAQTAFTDEMFGHTFFYDAFPPDETIALVEEIGFNVVAAELIDIPTGGRAKGRLAIAADKQLLPLY